MADTHASSAGDSPSRVTRSACWVSDADRSALFALVKDQSTWTSWTDIDDLIIEREGSGGPCGVGAVRRVAALGLELREEIIEVVEGQRISYRLLSGLPIHDYVGVTDFETMPCGRTLIRWTSSFVASPQALATGVPALIANVVRTLCRQASLAIQTPQLRDRRLRGRNPARSTIQS